MQRIAFKVACLSLFFGAFLSVWWGRGRSFAVFLSCVCTCGCVCVGARVCVGAARPGPVQLYYSVDLHSKLYMLVFTFCFSNKRPWSTCLFGLLFKWFQGEVGFGNDSAVILVESTGTGRGLG